MKRSDQRILTTHVGSLPRPDDLMALYAANAPDEKLQPRLRAAVGDIVRRNVGLQVADNDDLNVLGMNYLSSLSRWGVEGRWLVLVS